MITLAEARERIGDGVVYHDPGDRVSEDGTITSVSAHFVFVHYKGDNTSKATAPNDLEWLAR